MQDLLVTEYEVALFPKNFSLTNPAKTLSDIISSVEQLRAGQPTLLPIPDSAPQEVPRIIIKSDNGRFELQLSLSKFSVFYRNVNEDSNFNPDEINALTAALLGLGVFSQVRFQRVGFIVTAVLPTNDIEFISGNVLRENASNGLANFNLQLTYHDSVATRKSNLAVLLSSAANSETEQRGLMLKADLNTLAEEDADANGDSVIGYLKAAKSKNALKKVLNRLTRVATSDR